MDTPTRLLSPSSASPGQKIRKLKRLFSFRQKKPLISKDQTPQPEISVQEFIASTPSKPSQTPQLEICAQESISFMPNKPNQAPKLEICVQESIAFTPNKPNQAPKLEICAQESIAFKPALPSLSVTVSPAISISPEEQPKLFTSIHSNSITPKPVNNHAIVRVCLSMLIWILMKIKISTDMIIGNLSMEQE